MLGTTVSHYTILEKIGAGGMGEVYLAEDTKLKRQVALKFLSEELTRDEERKQRFLQEARAAAAVEHPHIAAIYDIDEVDGRTFIAMEYVRGESLRAAIDATKLNQRQSLELAIQIGEGLSKAHERGVVHRDVKPGNVVVSEDGDAKIIDFGLAKLFEPPTGGDGPVESEAETLLKTQEGMVLGTLTYMSPEQASGQPLDPRTDIFSLGAVLYEMHSGVSPFRRETPVATLRALLEESPPTLPESAAPTKLQRILGKALAKERSERYANMKDLLADLEELRDSLYPPAAPATSHVGRKWLRAGAALGVAVLVAAAFYLGSRRATPPGIGASGRPAIAVMYFESMTGDEEIQWLSKGVPSMLVTDLAQTPGLDVVSSQRIQEILAQVGEDNLESIDRNLFTELARRAGAGAVLLGSIFKSGDVIRIDVQLEEVGSGRLLSAQSVRGADVFPLVDELTARIRTSLELGDRPAGRGIAEITTPSLEAYQRYSEGLEALRNLRQVDAGKFFLQAVEIDPSFAMAYFQLSKAARFPGPLGEPERYLQEALEFQDKLPERQRLQLQAWVAWRATRRGEEGAFQDAFELYETLISRYPDEEDAYQALAYLHHRRRDNATFITTLERGVEAVPSSGQLHNSLGYGLLRAGRYPEAIRALEIYASLNPGEPNPQDSLGDAYLVSGQPEKALERFTRALEIESSFYAAHGGLAWAYGMLGRYDDAVEEMDAQGRFLAREGIPAAVHHLDRAYLLSRVGRYDEALEARREVDKFENKRTLSSCELWAGIIAIEREAYPRALEHAQRLQRLLPLVSNERQRTDRVIQAHLLAGVAEARAGNLEAARAQLEAQNRLDIDTDQRLWWHGALAGEVALAEGDLAAAESAFAGGEPEFKMQASRWQIAANGLPFRDGLARVKKARGDLAGAIEIYHLLNTPDIANKWTAMVEPRYVLETARLLDETGDKEGAKAEYERFLELWKNADSDLPELAEARAYLAQ